MEMPIDTAIRQWQSYLTNISSNLMELTDQTDYQLIKLKAEDATNGYIGITKVKAESCMESVGELWQHFALLSEVVEKAVALNNKRSLLYNSADEVWELLEDTLIVVDKEHVNINERNLLEDKTNEKKAKPKELLKHMQESFDSLCKDITEISNAEQTLQSRLSNIKSDIKKLDSSLGRLGISNMPVFDFNKVAQMERDPLQGMLELDKLVYSLEKYRASIKTIEEDFNEIVQKFAIVKEMLSEINELAVKSKTAAAESKRIFGDNQSVYPVIEEDVLNSLKDWLLILEKKLYQGGLKAVKVGVSKLEKECSLKLEAEREGYSVNSRAYTEWLDLKGHFKALLAKAEILKGKGLLMDNSLDDLIEMTNSALHANPVNLEVCRGLVRKFKSSL